MKVGTGKWESKLGPPATSQKDKPMTTNYMSERNSPRRSSHMRRKSRLRVFCDTERSNQGFNTAGGCGTIERKWENPLRILLSPQHPLLGFPLDISPYFPTPTTPSILESLMETGSKGFRYNEQGWPGSWCCGDLFLITAMPTSLCLASGQISPQVSSLHYTSRVNHLTQLVRIWVKSECLVLLSLLVKYGQLAVSQGLRGLNGRYKVPRQQEKLTDDVMLKTPWGSSHRRVVNQLILGWMDARDW